MGVQHSPLRKSCSLSTPYGLTRSYHVLRPQPGICYTPTGCMRVPYRLHRDRTVRSVSARQRETVKVVKTLLSEALCSRRSHVN